MRTHQAHTVSVRQSWGDAWTVVPQLFCDRCKFCTAPEMPEASFSYRYGEVMGYGEIGFANREPLNYLNWLVKVTINQSDGTTREWYGVFIDDSQERHGDGAQHLLTSGRQMLIARGLEILLHRQPIITSEVIDTAGVPKQIGHALGFNLGGGADTDTREQGNMGRGDDNVPRFSMSLVPTITNAVSWTNFDIIDYLINFHGPKSPTGAEVVPFRWDATSSNNDILKRQALAFHHHGMTFREVMNVVCDRRRLLTWWVEVVDDICRIKIANFNDAVFAFPDGQIVNPNANQVEWYFEDDARVRMAVLSETAATQITRVYAQGEKLTGTFTIQYDDLEADWDTALEANYEAGATGDMGYTDLNTYEQVHADQRARYRDELQKVWRYFRIKPTWDGTINAGFTAFRADTFGQARFWWPGLRLLPRLPLQTEQNYAVMANVTNNGKASTYPELRRPFAVQEEYVAGGGANYSYLHQRGSGDSIEEQAKAGERQWACQLRMQETMPGLILDVHGAPQHVIAKDEFTPADATDTQAGYAAEIDWKDIQFTVCAEFHDYAQAMWPQNQAGIGDVDTVLYIRCPHKRYDYLAPGTIVDIDDEGQLVQTDGGWIQDDLAELKNIARSAYEWYSAPRAAIEIETHSLDAAFPATVGGPAIPFYVGYLVVAVGEGPTYRQVNAIINSIDFNLRAGSLRVSTAFTDFDFARAT